MTEQQDLFSEIMPPAKPRHVERMQQVQEGLPAQLFLGTTSWSNADWEGLIYPEGCAAADYIEHYAKVFGSVEIDSTWYRVPTPKAIEGWLRRTPPHFRFTAKIPRVISHEKCSWTAWGKWKNFSTRWPRWGERLGPLLMQFPYIARGQDAHEKRVRQRVHRAPSRVFAAATYGRVQLCGGGAQRKLAAGGIVRPAARTQGGAGAEQLLHHAEFSDHR